ncbi:MULTISPECIES: hypothetical protein [Pseudomonas]|uniref:hypothetical protein n=1 Tax=Pseudomonas TaxID=286 RepID=UPI001CEDBDAD|nr:MULTISPECIES: hypothetical protein [Pseudomonas]
MPTENRSSNTEMVSVPEGYMLVERSIWTEQQVEAATACITRLKGVPTMTDRALAIAAIDAAQCTAPDIALSYLLPTPQPHPEPIAWMVGTAFWWTKEEAQRDAAAAGMPMIPVGPMTGAGDIGLAREMLHRALRREDKWAFLCSGRNKQMAELRAKLAELPEMLISAIEREQERCSQEDYLMDSDDCIKVIREALADIGVPVPPDQPYQGIPGTSFQRLNALANQGE